MLGDGNTEVANLSAGTQSLDRPAPLLPLDPGIGPDVELLQIDLLDS